MRDKSDAVHWGVEKAVRSGFQLLCRRYVSGLIRTAGKTQSN